MKRASVYHLRIQFNIFRFNISLWRRLIFKGLLSSMKFTHAHVWLLQKSIPWLSECNNFKTIDIRRIAKQWIKRCSFCRVSGANQKIIDWNYTHDLFELLLNSTRVGWRHIERKWQALSRRLKDVRFLGLYLEGVLMLITLVQENRGTGETASIFIFSHFEVYILANYIASLWSLIHNFPCAHGTAVPTTNYEHFNACGPFQACQRV